MHMSWFLVQYTVSVMGRPVTIWKVLNSLVGMCNQVFVYKSTTLEKVKLTIVGSANTQRNYNIYNSRNVPTKLNYSRLQ